MFFTPIIMWKCSWISADDWNIVSLTYLHFNNRLSDCWLMSNEFCSCFFFLSGLIISLYVIFSFLFCPQDVTYVLHVLFGHFWPLALKCCDVSDICPYSFMCFHINYQVDLELKCTFGYIYFDGWNVSLMSEYFTEVNISVLGQKIGDPSCCI